MENALILPHRKQDAHKYTAGVVGLYVGSETYPGAAILAIMAAFRAGAGMVVAFTQVCIRDLLIKACPEAIVIGLDATQTSYEHSDYILNAIDCYKINSFAIGSGLGKEKQAACEILACQLLEKTTLPFILDADALTACMWAKLELKQGLDRVIITPHLGEYSRFFNQTVHLENRFQSLKKISAKTSLNIVLKGSPSLIACNGRLWENKSGNAALATAGSGDVLLGILAAFLNAFSCLQTAVRAAVHYHAKTAERYLQDAALESMMARDIIDLLPQVIKESRRR